MFPLYQKNCLLNINHRFLIICTQVKYKVGPQVKSRKDGRYFSVTGLASIWNLVHWSEKKKKKNIEIDMTLSTKIFNISLPMVSDCIRTETLFTKL